MRHAVDFVVHGQPRPAGSKRAFVNRSTGRAHITDVSGDDGRNWRTDVRSEARPHFTVDGHLAPCEGPMIVSMTFYRARPKSHYGSGRNSHLVRASAPAHFATTPDVDKVTRAMLDALTGLAYHDDRQVVDLHARQRWTTGLSRVEVHIDELTARRAEDLPIQERTKEEERT